MIAWPSIGRGPWVRTPLAMLKTARGKLGISDRPPLHEGEGAGSALSRGVLVSRNHHGTIRWASLVPAAMMNAPPCSRLSGKPVDAAVASGIAIVI